MLGKKRRQHNKNSFNEYAVCIGCDEYKKKTKKNFKLGVDFLFIRSNI